MSEKQKFHIGVNYMDGKFESFEAVESSKHDDEMLYIVQIPGSPITIPLRNVRHFICDFNREKQ